LEENNTQSISLSSPPCSDFCFGTIFFFGTKNRQMVTQFFEMEYSVANSLFFEKKLKNSPESDRKLVFWGRCHHVYAYWLQF